MSVDIERLRALLAVASPAPWRECGHDRGGCVCRLVWATDVDCVIARADTVFDGEGPTNETQAANAALIAEMRNALPGLLDRLTAAESELAHLRTAFAALVEEQRTLRRRLTAKHGHVAALESAAVRLRAESEARGSVLAQTRIAAWLEGLGRVAWTQGERQHGASCLVLADRIRAGDWLVPPARPDGAVPPPVGPDDERPRVRFDTDPRSPDPAYEPFLHRDHDELREEGRRDERRAVAEHLRACSRDPEATAGEREVLLSQADVIESGAHHSRTIDTGCDAEHPDGWSCTLETGHSGLHKAHGSSGSLYYAWPRDAHAIGDEDEAREGGGVRDGE